MEEEKIMTVKVKVPMALRKLTGGNGDVEVEGANIGQVIDNLEAKHKGLKDALCDGSGNVRGYVNIYINDEDFRSLDNTDTALKDGDELTIIPAIAGGLLTGIE